MPAAHVFCNKGRMTELAVPEEMLLAHYPSGFRFQLPELRWLLVFGNSKVCFSAPHEKLL